MIVQLNWPAEIVERLTRQARQNGLSLEAWLLKIVLEQTEGADGRIREEAVASIRELRRGNILGPDISIRDLIEEGRRF